MNLFYIYSSFICEYFANFQIQKMSTSNNNTSSTSNIATTTITTTLNVTTLTTTNTVALVTTNNTNSTTTTLNATPVTWNKQEIRLLIDQRKHKNTEYHQIIGRSRKSFWSSVARRINRAAGSQFSGKHYRQKFQNLVSAYYVSKSNII